MEKENKKNTIITILLCIIFLLIGLIVGVVIDKKINQNENTVQQKEEKEEVEEEKSELSTEDVLDSLVGEWGMCLGEYDCRGIIISKNNNSEYTYTPYIMWSDGGQAGTINNVSKIEENKYKLKVYYKGYEGEIGSSPEQTVEYEINLTELSFNIVYVNDTKFQKITTDREVFFKSIMQ